MVGAAERLAAGDHADAAEWVALVDGARDRLASPRFNPFPLRGFEQVVKGKRRVLVAVPPEDRLLYEALLPIVAGAYEAVAPPSVHGFRKGRSTFTAALALRDALQAGCHHLLLVDVADFFPSIDRSRLPALLSGLVPPGLAALVAALVEAPLCMGRGRPRPTQGLPLGLPLSPVLSNLVLLPVDRALEHAPVRVVRYGDDVTLTATTASDLASAEHVLVAELQRLGFALKEAKTRRLVYEGAPLSLLGHAVDDRRVFVAVQAGQEERLLHPVASDESAGAEAPPEPARMRTVYVTEPGVYLCADAGLLVCRKGDEVLRQVPFHRIDRVVVLAGGSYSSGFLSGCILRRIPILFFVGKGRGYGCLVAEGTANPLRLRAQYDLRGDPERCFAIASAILDAKLRAMAQRLVRADPKGARRRSLEHLRGTLPRARDLDHLRGIEGAASATYFEGFATRLKDPGFAFVRRSKRPPLDPINSLLSFAYSLLFGEMQTALLAHGLDPHPGFLHELHRTHPALASDLIEPYRSLVADTFVLGLVNTGVVKAEGFERAARGAVFMTDDTRRTVLERWEDFVSRPLGPGGANVSPRALVAGAVLAMLAVVLGETSDLRLPLALEDTEPHPGSAEVVGCWSPVPAEDLVEPEAATAPPENAAPPRPPEA